MMIKFTFAKVNFSTQKKYKNFVKEREKTGKRMQIHNITPFLTHFYTELLQAQKMVHTQEIRALEIWTLI